MKTVQDKVERGIRFPELRPFVEEDSLKTVQPFTYLQADEGDSVGEIVQALGDDDAARTEALRTAVNEYWKGEAQKQVQKGPNEVVNGLRDNVKTFNEVMGMEMEAALALCLSQKVVRDKLVEAGVIFNENAPAVTG
jgi:hypothetical protein